MKGLARRTDPGTSQEAAQSVNEKPLYIYLRALHESGGNGLTADEARIATGLPDDHERFYQLKRLGWAELHLVFRRGKFVPLQRRGSRGKMQNIHYISLEGRRHL